MHVIRNLMVLTLLLSPAAAAAQSVELLGSAGPTITDAGHSVSAGAGFWPTRHLMFAVNAERTHLSSQVTPFDDGVSLFRGGTLLLGSAELRVAPLGRDRIGPFGLVGLAAGVSRPNVNAMFPTPVTNQVRAMFVGGGVQVPFARRFSFVADARMMFGADGNEGIVAVAPVRAGIALRF